ncbi:tubulin polyglutamylase TTLL6 isoform X2 [Lissotriton helveticus]
MVGGTLRCIQSVQVTRKVTLPQIPTTNVRLPHLNFRDLCESAAGCSSEIWWRRRAERDRMKSPTLQHDGTGSPGSPPMEDLWRVTTPSDPFTLIGASVSDSCENPRSRDMNRNWRKKKRKDRLAINLSNCKYESVRRAARRYGLHESCDTNDWSLFWTDCSVSLDRALDMKGYQKINHFPGMNEICRKDTLARNMSRMQKLFPKEYHLLPRSWCLPADYGDLQAYGRTRKHRTYICKPDMGCQGRGIYITRSVKDIGPGEDMICQLYISKDNICMHLTNYSINKHSENFIRDDNSGSKRKLSTINKYLQNHGYNTAQIWEDIEDVIIKTLIAAHPIIKHNYTSCFPSHSAGSACFEILGFDILLDRKLRPWLLEVNHSPSFSTDSRLDREVKDALLYDTLVLINLGACSKKKVLEEERQRVRERLNASGTSKESRAEKQRSLQVAWTEQAEQYEEKNMGGFRRIFPKRDAENYEKFFQQSSSIFQETAASRARGQCTRQQLQDLRLKQEVKVTPSKSRKAEQMGESPGEKSPSCRDGQLHRAAMARGSRQLLHNTESRTGSLPPKSANSDKSAQTEGICTDSSPLWQPLSEDHHTGEQTPQSLETSAARHASSVPNIRIKNFSITEHQLGQDSELQHCRGPAHRSTLDVTLGPPLLHNTESRPGSLPPKSANSDKSARTEGICTDSSPLCQPLSEDHHTGEQTPQSLETSAARHASSVPNIGIKNFSITENQLGQDSELQHCRGPAHRSTLDVTLGPPLLHNTESRPGSLPPKSANSDKSARTEGICTDSSPLCQPLSEDHHTGEQTPQSLETSAARHASSVPNIRIKNFSITEHQLGQDSELQHCRGRAHCSTLDVTLGPPLLHNTESRPGSLPPKSANSDKSARTEGICTDSSPLWQPLSEDHHTGAQTPQSLETSAARHASSVPNIGIKNFSITENQLGQDPELQHCRERAHRSTLDVTLGPPLIKRTDFSITHEDWNLFLSPSCPVQLALKRAIASMDVSKGPNSAPQIIAGSRLPQDQVPLLWEGGSPVPSLLTQESPPPLENVPPQVWKTIEPGSRERSLEDCELLRKQRLGPTAELPIVHKEQSRKLQHRHRAQSAVHLRRLGQGDRQKGELAESHLVMPNTSNLLVVSRPAPLFQRPGLAVHTRKAPHTGDTVRGRL